MKLSSLGSLASTAFDTARSTIKSMAETAAATRVEPAATQPSVTPAQPSAAQPSPAQPAPVEASPVKPIEAAVAAAAATPPKPAKAPRVGSQLDAFA